MGIVLDPTKCFLPHPNEEILEEYILHRLPEPLVAQVEEHLLICPLCQDAITETDQFVAAFKAAPVQPAPPTVRPGWLDARTNLVPVLALVILALVVVWTPNTRRFHAGCGEPFLAARDESPISGPGRKAAATLHRRAGSTVRQEVRRRSGGCGRRPGLEGNGIGDRREAGRDDVQAVG